MDAGGPAVEPNRPPITLATGIFITGNVGLVAGNRYTIQVEGEHFQVLGPVDVDPTQIALERPLSEMDATAFEGRLVISEPGRQSSGVVLAFMSLAGGSPDGVADALVRLADAGRPT
ncbi:MAG: hypothetical protein ACSLFN_07860 [Candidatus Limnocylindrales bacterium]